MKYLRLFRRLCAWLRPMQISLHSAYTSFFLILSMFPSVMLLLGFLKYTPIGIKDLLRFLEGLLPEALLPTAVWLVETAFDHSSGAMLSLSAVAALWSASRGMFGLVQGLNAVQGLREFRGYLRSRLLCMGYTFLFLLLLLVTVLLHIAGNAFADYLLMTTRPAALHILGKLDLQFWILLILLTGFFCLMYALLPAGRSRLRPCLPGSLLAGLGWLLSSKLFGIYMAHFGSYSNIFGSLYALALGLLWLYFCISLVFYGSVLNQLLLSKFWEK